MNQEDIVELERLEKEFLTNPNVDLCQEIAMIYWFNKDKNKSKEYYQKALEMQIEIVKDKNISDYKPFLQLAYLYSEVDDNTNERIVYKRVLDYLLTQPETTEILNDKGHIYDSLGMRKEAIICYEKAIEYEPNNINILESLMFIYSDITSHFKNIDKAKEIARKILEIEPNNDMAKFELERKNINIDLSSGWTGEKRLILDSTEECLTEDVIEFLTKCRWWVYIIFAGSLGYVVFLVYLVLTSQIH